MKILITGADGFTGKYFSSEAVKNGHEIIALKANLNDVESLNQEVLWAAPDAVVHLAAISFVGHDDSEEFYRVNVIGTLNLLDALSKLKQSPQKILLASSANVYGNCEKSPIFETQSPSPVNHYAASKLACEYLAKTYLDKLNIFFVRPFNYTGKGQSDSFIIPKLISHFRRKSPTIELGNIHVEREFNDVRFVCNAYIKLLDKAKVGETYNICSGNPVSLKNVIALLTDITNHQMHVKINSDFVRKNEVFRLTGSPDKLRQEIGDVDMPLLIETLKWMLNEGA